MKSTFVLSFILFILEVLASAAVEHYDKDEDYHKDQFHVSPVRKTVFNNAVAWPPQEDEIQITPQGEIYLHVTTIYRWVNVTQNSQVRRVKGQVNALGKGFYTYPERTMTGARFNTLIQWAKIEAEDEEEMRQELKDKVRIVAVYPKHNVWTWKPQRNLPDPNDLNNKLTNFSNEGNMNFLAIMETKSGSDETVWLNAKVDQGIVQYPVEDGSPMDWLVTQSVRQMTPNEINQYINYSLGNGKK